MSEADGRRFACGACGRSYRWKPELAGRTAKCKCGQAIRVPAEEPAVASEAIDEVPVPPPPAPARTPPPAIRPKPAALPRAAAGAPPPVPVDMAPTTKACPSCGEGVPANAVLCIACGYDFRTGKRLSTTIDTGSDDE